MELKRATAEDVDIYLALEKSLGEQKLYSIFSEKDEAIKELKNSVVYFIVEKGEVIGHISYEKKDKDHAYLSGILIKPEYQSRGFAREAMGKILKELKSVKTIDLVTHPDNIKSINLCKSFGFKQAERYENYFGDGEPRVRLVLQ